MKPRVQSAAFTRTCQSAFVLTLALLSAHCGPSSSGSLPTCEQAMGNAYAVGCAITSGGSPVSEAAAINGCNQGKALIDNGCACGAQFDAALICTNGLGRDQCSDCSPQFADLDRCMAANSKCN
jgi:hypothetical protein